MPTSRTRAGLGRAWASTQTPPATQMVASSGPGQDPGDGPKGLAPERGPRSVLRPGAWAPRDEIDVPPDDPFSGDKYGQLGRAFKRTWARAWNARGRALDG
eukprot:9158236-Alexandrium_andersonii.AAC.1